MCAKHNFENEGEIGLEVRVSVTQLESDRKWKSLSRVQLFATLCLDYPVLGILQARILERVAFPFSSGPSQPRNQTGVSCIAGRFLTSWAVREAPIWGKVTEADVNSLQSDYRPNVSNSG